MHGSLTTWIDSTLANVAPLGTITHRVATTSTGQKSVICWKHGSKEVYLGESTMLGRKRALYDVLNNPRIIGQIRALESKAAIDARVKSLAAEYDGDFIDADECEGFGPFVIESDPYVAA
jgi:hypothetical protein